MKATPAVRRALEARIEVITEELAELRDERRELQQELAAPKPSSRGRSNDRRGKKRPVSTKPRHETVLELVRRYPGSRTPELAERSELSDEFDTVPHGSFGGALTKLEAEGLIRREVGEGRFDITYYPVSKPAGVDVGVPRDHDGKLVESA